MFQHPWRCGQAVHPGDRGRHRARREGICGVEDGFRESEQSWREVLVNLKHRGLKLGPELAVGDGALGFGKALAKVYGETRAQRC